MDASAESGSEWMTGDDPHKATLMRCFDCGDIYQTVPVFPRSTTVKAHAGRKGCHPGASIRLSTEMIGV